MDWEGVKREGLHITEINLEVPSVYGEPSRVELPGIISQLPALKLLAISESGSGNWVGDHICRKTGVLTGNLP